MVSLYLQVFTDKHRKEQPILPGSCFLDQKKKKKYHMTCLTIERQLERAPVILTTISECQSSPFLTQEADHSGSYLWVQSHPALKVILCKIGAC